MQLLSSVGHTHSPFTAQTLRWKPGTLTRGVAWEYIGVPVNSRRLYTWLVFTAVHAPSPYLQGWLSLPASNTPQKIITLDIYRENSGEFSNKWLVPADRAQGWCQTVSMIPIVSGRLYLLLQTLFHISSCSKAFLLGTGILRRFCNRKEYYGSPWKCYSLDLGD